MIEGVNRENSSVQAVLSAKALEMAIGEESSQARLLNTLFADTPQKGGESPQETATRQIQNGGRLDVKV